MTIQAISILFYDFEHSPKQLRLMPLLLKTQSSSSHHYLQVSSSHTDRASIRICHDAGARHRSVFLVFPESIISQFQSNIQNGCIIFMLIIQYTSKQLNTSADKMAGFIRGSSLGFN